jgi:hypothetical protein
MIVKETVRYLAIFSNLFRCDDLFLNFYYMTNLFGFIVLCRPCIFSLA